MKKAFFPAITSDHTSAEITLPEGGPFKDTLRVLQQVEAAAQQVKSEYNSDPKFNGREIVGDISARGRINVRKSAQIKAQNTAADVKNDELKAFVIKELTKAADAAKAQAAAVALLKAVDDCAAKGVASASRTISNKDLPAAMQQPPLMPQETVL